MYVIYSIRVSEIDAENTVHLSSSLMMRMRNALSSALHPDRKSYFWVFVSTLRSEL